MLSVPWGGGRDRHILTMALHQRHRQSCSLRTLPQVRSQTAQRALTGRFPSSHWWGMATCGEGQSPMAHQPCRPRALEGQRHGPPPSPSTTEEVGRG